MKMYRAREDFYLLDWYSLNKKGLALAKRICDKLEPKQLQDNCSRGATPGLIDPAKGEALGNRVPLPYVYGMIHDPNILGERRQFWKPFTLSQAPETIQPSTGSSVRESQVTRPKQVHGTLSPNSAPDDSNEESSDSQFSEIKHSAGPIVKPETFSKDTRLILCDKEPNLEAQRRQRTMAVGDTEERLTPRPSDSEKPSEEDHMSIQGRTTYKQTKAKPERRTAASSKATEITELSGKGQNLDFSEGEASSGPRVEMKTSEIQFMQAGKIQSARTLRPSEHNQHKHFDGNSMGQAGEAEQESKDVEDLPSDETPRTSNQDPNSNLARGAERIPSSAATIIAIPSDQPYKIRSERQLIYTVNGAPRLRPQPLYRNAKNTNRAQPKCELARRLPPVAVPEASNEDQDPASVRATVSLSVRGKRRQKRQPSVRCISNPDRDDQERGKVQRSPPPVVMSSEDDMRLNQLRFAPASPRSARATAPRYILRKRVSADHNKPSSRPSQMFLNSGDESENYRRQRPEMKFPVHARKYIRTRNRFSDTNPEKFVPSPSDSDEIPGIRPRTKRHLRGIIERTQRFSMEPSRKRSIEARVESDIDVAMEDMPLTAICEPSSMSSAKVVPSSPGKDAAVAETKGPTAPGPSNRSRAASGLSMDTFVEEVIELRSKISSLKPLGSLTSMSLGEQVDRVAVMAIELRAGTNRLLEEIASLREAVDRYNGLR